MNEHSPAGTPRRWKDNLALGFASVLFLGYAPVASGTVGSLPAIGVSFLLRNMQTIPLLLIVLLFFLGLAVSSHVSVLLGRKDPGEVTIDEFVGMLVAYLWLPMTWSCIVVVFIMFRAFDIFKPFPARQAERLGGGLGIMADDIIAGLYANLAYRLLLLVF